MKLNKKRKVFLAVVVVLILLPAIFWKQIAIRYHIASYNTSAAGIKGIRKVNKLKYVSLEKNELWHICEYNLDRLVELGYLQCIDYTYKNIKSKSESNHLTDCLVDRYPEFFECAISHSKDKPTCPDIYIWYEPKYHNDWQQFFKETDASDYKTKFQVEEEEKEADPAVKK